MGRARYKRTNSSIILLLHTSGTLPLLGAVRVVDRSVGQSREHTENHVRFSRPLGLIVPLFRYFTISRDGGCCSYLLPTGNYPWAVLAGNYC